MSSLGRPSRGLCFLTYEVRLMTDPALQDGGGPSRRKSLQGPGLGTELLAENVQLASRADDGVPGFWVMTVRLK